MEGDVAVKSAPDLGSSFTVTIVLLAGPSNSIPAKLAARRIMGSAARPRGTLHRALVVDDHPVNREVLTLQLKLLGIAADSAGDGVDALAQWAPGRYAVVLADVHMPRMDGHELARRLRAAESEDDAGRSPIIAITANAVIGEEERCLAAGIDACLVKPVSIERLRTTLARWLAIEGEDSSGDRGDQEAAAAIDRNVLEAWLGDDRAAIDSLLGKFRETALESEREIEAATGMGDLMIVVAAAHKLKGAAQMVGAMGVGAAAAALEEASRAGDRGRCSGLLGPLVAQMRHAIAHIDGSRRRS
jgi:CheY-like chemotaxis protein/HPt (histidine-containing phosphotransfer) domain-containing protein